LQRRKVELLYIHDTALLADLNSSIRASLISLRAHGAEFLGASIYDLADLDYVLAAGFFDVIQLPLNVFDSRFTPEVIHLAQNEGCKVYARSIFLQGVLLSRPADLPPAVSALAPYVARFMNTCAEWGVEPIDALARFIVERRDVDGLVIGVSSLRELERLSQALSASVAPGLLDSLEALEKPSWVLADPRNWS
jgi:aryl-alcohol dehydrogenase-like predicted oxidoreductase